MKWKIILILIIAWRVGYSQDSLGFFVNYGAEKYSMNFDELYSGLYYNDFVESDNIVTRLASMSFVKYKNRIIREWEIMPFSFSKKEFSNFYTTNTGTYGLDGKTVRKYSSYLRYFRGYSLWAPDKRAVLYIGISAGMRYDRVEVEPYYNSVFPTYNSIVKADLAVNPYFKVRLKNNYFFTAGIPFQFFGCEMLNSREDNPQLPIKISRSTNISIETFPKYYMFKLGLGVEF